MFVLLLTACEAEPEGKPAPADPPVLDGELSSSDPHAIVFSASVAADLRCASEAPADVLRASVGPVAAPVRGFLAGTTYRCAATTDEHRSNTVELTTPPLPERFPVAEVDTAGQPAQVGLRLVNLGRLLSPDGSGTAWFDGEFLAVLDAEGRPRWHTMGVGGGDIDVTWLEDGTLLYGGFGGNRSIPPTVLTLDGEVVMEVPYTTDTPWEVPVSWHHDVGVSEDGATLWALAEEQIPVDDELSWRGFVIKELDRATGDTLWAWSSYDDGVATGDLPAGDAYEVDPYHANAVFDATEGGARKLYVSLRNQNQVVRIDVESRRVDLRVGLDGDLALLDTDGAPAEEWAWFYGQHDAKRIGDKLVVYDNGLGRDLHGSAPWSRALVLDIDEDAGTARIETGWRGDEDWISPAWGGLDRREDGRLDLAIGHFWWIAEDSPLRSTLALLDPDAEGDAELVWRVRFPDQDVALYRSAPVLYACDTFPIEAYCF